MLNHVVQSLLGNPKSSQFQVGRQPAGLAEYLEAHGLAVLNLDIPSHGLQRGRFGGCLTRQFGG